MPRKYEIRKAKPFREEFGTENATTIASELDGERSCPESEDKKRCRAESGEPVDSGYYSAYAGLLARTEALDSAASNLANANTVGFRAEREFFKAALNGPDSSDSQLDTVLNSPGVLGGNRLDLGQGQLSSTGGTFDLAIQGNGFFAFSTAAGIRYTRDGAFQRGAGGTLQTRDGSPILDPVGKPLLVPAGDFAVGTDGSVSLNGAIAGKIGIFELAADTVVPEGSGRYRNLGSGPPPVSHDVHIRQRYLESSNQDPIQGSLQLLMVQRQAEMMQKAVTLFQTSFDKPASEDLPRI